VLKSFSKDKSPGPDRWTVELFLKYFDLIGNDVHEAMDESRNLGSMVRSLNSTFIALILKVDNPTRFGDFRTISLCNIAYKVIAKLIGMRLKSLFSKALYSE
jgi:hypothetical protein